MRQNKDSQIRPKSQKRKGQSFVEFALALPVLLLMIGGLAEVAFFINDYLDLLDASREGARYGTNLDYSSTFVNSGDPCDTTTTHFFYVVGCLVEDNLNRVSTIQFDSTQDDIVVSVFTMQDAQGTTTGPIVQARFPTGAYSIDGWSFATGGTGIGCGGTCASKFTDMPNDGVTGPLEQALQNAGTLHLTPTTVSNSGYGDLNNAVVVVEVFYNHYQRLGLPFFNYLPNPIRTYAYSIFPQPSAEPTATSPAATATP